ncbi:MAG: DUF6637 family protein [Lachnospiraceae bacterium]
MFVQERRKNPRNITLILDLLHIVVGILVVIFAVLAFLNPEKHQFLFPVIFLLAALLNGVNSWFKWRASGRDKRRKMNAAVSCLIAALLFLIGLISAASIWR